MRINTHRDHRRAWRSEEGASLVEFTIVASLLFHAAIAELIAAAHEAPNGTPGAADVVAAAHRVADVARGGPGEPQGKAVGRNGDPSPESPQRGEGSPASDPPAPAGPLSDDAPGNSGTPPVRIDGDTEPGS